MQKFNELQNEKVIETEQSYEEEKDEEDETRNDDVDYRRTKRVILRRRRRCTGLPLKIVQKNIVLKAMRMFKKMNQLIP